MNPQPFRASAPSKPVNVEGLDGTGQRPTKVGLNSSLVLAGTVGTILAVAVVLLVYTVARLTGDSLVVAPEFGGAPAPLSAVVAGLATVAGGLAGTALAWLMRRLAAPPRHWFGVVCVVLLIGYGLLSFVRAEEVSTGVWLNIMHIGAAVAIIGTLWLALGAAPAPGSGGRIQPTGSSTYPRLRTVRIRRSMGSTRRRSR